MMRERTSYRKDDLARMIGTLADITARPMFGYQCYSVRGKFFVGFGKKNNLIIRLSKELQAQALQDRQMKFKRFSHGAKMGWVELELNELLDNAAVFDWIKKGYENARLLAKNE